MTKAQSDSKHDARWDWRGECKARWRSCAREIVVRQETKRRAKGKRAETLQEVAEGQKERKGICKGMRQRSHGAREAAAQHICTQAERRGPLGAGGGQLYWPLQRGWGAQEPRKVFKLGDKRPQTQPCESGGWGKEPDGGGIRREWVMKTWRLTVFGSERRKENGTVA